MQQIKTKKNKIKNSVIDVLQKLGANYGINLV